MHDSNSIISKQIKTQIIYIDQVVAVDTEKLTEKIAKTNSSGLIKTMEMTTGQNVAISSSLQSFLYQDFQLKTFLQNDIESGRGYVHQVNTT